MGQKSGQLIMIIIRRLNGIKCGSFWASLFGHFGKLAAPSWRLSGFRCGATLVAVVEQLTGQEFDQSGHLIAARKQITIHYSLFT